MYWLLYLVTSVAYNGCDGWLERSQPDLHGHHVLTFKLASTVMLVIQVLYASLANVFFAMRDEFDL